MISLVSRRSNNLFYRHIFSPRNLRTSNDGFQNLMHAETLDHVLYFFETPWNRLGNGPSESFRSKSMVLPRPVSYRHACYKFKTDCFSNRMLDHDPSGIVCQVFSDYYDPDLTSETIMFFVSLFRISNEETLTFHPDFVFSIIQNACANHFFRPRDLRNGLSWIPKDQAEGASADAILLTRKSMTKPMLVNQS